MIGDLDTIDLSYAVADKVILQRVNFSIKRGDLCALMGPSGSGKSTLLDLLADRKKEGKYSGDIFVDKRPRAPWFTRYSAYVLQDDVHIGTLSVRETIYFSACMRMEEGSTASLIDNRVEFLLDKMGLRHIATNVVGNSLQRGISGGELKRLSIAVEIVALPTFIFLDEPTSGLDSLMSLEVMSAVKNFADDARTILATIHQPSPEVFGLFNKVALVSNGRLIYFGPSDKIINYFTRPELGYRVEQMQDAHDPYARFNPADFIVNISAGLLPSTAIHRVLTSEELESHFRTSPAYLSTEAIGATLTDSGYHHAVQQSVDSFNDNSSRRRDFKRLHATSKWTQFSVLIRREWLTFFRSSSDMGAMFGKSVVVGLLIGIVFYDQIGKVQSPLFTNGVPSASVANVSALLFFGLMDAVISNMQAIPGLIFSCTLSRRELAAHAYCASAYWLSKILYLLPILFFNHTFYLAIIYFMCGFPLQLDYALYYYFMMAFLVLISYYFAMFLAAASASEKIALSLFPLVFVFFSTFAGFSVTIDSVPVFWSWATYISFCRWSYEGLMVNQWGGVDTSGDPMGGSGEDVLAIYDFDGFDKMQSVWIMMVFLAVQVIVIYFAMLPPRSTLAHCDDATREGRNLSSSIVNPALLLSVLREPLLEDGETSAFDSPAKSASERSDEVSPVEDVTSPLLEDERKDSSEPGFAQHPTVTNNISYTEAIKASTEIRPGCSLEFANVRYSVDLSTSLFSQSTSSATRGGSSKKELLRGVSGSVMPGEMCALMGASGAGKSTLLDVLANRKSHGYVSGTILFNGRTLEESQFLSEEAAKQDQVGSAALVASEDFERQMMMNSRSLYRPSMSAYVMQDNVHVGCLTVRETLMYAAELRLTDSESVRKEQKEQRVQTILEMLGLEQVSESFVGSEKTRGISGGQLKRLTIGVEIINLPDLIYLDEPTSGLDSAKALEVMTVVRQLTNQNRTLVCTIHQPSQQIFNLFDKVMVLAGGMLVYFGSMAGCVPYFAQRCKFRFPFVFGSNTADFVINVAGSCIPTVDGQIVSAEDLAGAFAGCDLNVALDDALQPSLARSSKAVEAMAEEKLRNNAAGSWFSRVLSCTNLSRLYAKQYNSSIFHQLKVLCGRQLLRNYRDPHYEISFFLRYTIIAAFYASIYYNQPGGTDPAVYYNRLALIFFSVLSVMVGHQSLMSELIEERLLFYRERGAKAYGEFSYWVSATFVSVIAAPPATLAYAVILYFAIGFNETSGGEFLFFLLVLIIDSLIGLYICVLTAAISHSTQVAVSLFPVVLFFSVAFAGYIVYIPNFPDWLGVWAPYVSFMRFAFQALALNELQQNDKLPVAQQYVDLLGFDSLSKGECLPVLLVFLGFYAVLSYLAIKYLSFEHR